MRYPIFLLSMWIGVVALCPTCQIDAQVNSFFDYSVTDIDGAQVKLQQFKGKKILVVNVASECGYTPQYAVLQSIYETYGPDDFVVIAFPANNFGEQEPGSNAEIKQFCSSQYQVSFPMMAKISVAGDDIHPLYQWLTQKSLNGMMDAPVKWNFQKFLINPDGSLHTMVAHQVAPDSEEIISWIQHK